MIDRMRLDEEWRGHRLSGPIVQSPLSLLKMRPDETAVVLYPEPLKPEGGVYDPGPSATRP